MLRNKHRKSLNCRATFALICGLLFGGFVGGIQTHAAPTATETTDTPTTTTMITTSDDANNSNSNSNNYNNNNYYNNNNNNSSVSSNSYSDNYHNYNYNNNNNINNNNNSNNDNDVVTSLLLSTTTTKTSSTPTSSPSSSSSSSSSSSPSMVDLTVKAIATTESSTDSIMPVDAAAAASVFASASSALGAVDAIAAAAAVNGSDGDDGVNGLNIGDGIVDNITPTTTTIMPILFNNNNSNNNINKNHSQLNMNAHAHAHANANTTMNTNGIVYDYNSNSATRTEFMDIATKNMDIATNNKMDIAAATEMKPHSESGSKSESEPQLDGKIIMPNHNNDSSMTFNTTTMASVSSAIAVEDTEEIKTSTASSSSSSSLPPTLMNSMSGMAEQMPKMAENNNNSNSSNNNNNNNNGNNNNNNDSDSTDITLSELNKLTGNSSATSLNNTNNTSANIDNNSTPENHDETMMTTPTKITLPHLVHLEATTTMREPIISFNNLTTSSDSMPSIDNNDNNNNNNNNNNYNNLTITTNTIMNNQTSPLASASASASVSSSTSSDIITANNNNISINYDNNDNNNALNNIITITTTPAANEVDFVPSNENKIEIKAKTEYENEKENENENANETKDLTTLAAAATTSTTTTTTTIAPTTFIPTKPMRNEKDKFQGVTENFIGSTFNDIYSDRQDNGKSSNHNLNDKYYKTSTEKYHKIYNKGGEDREQNINQILKDTRQPENDVKDLIDFHHPATLLTTNNQSAEEKNHQHYHNQQEQEQQQQQQLQINTQFHTFDGNHDRLTERIDNPTSFTESSTTSSSPLSASSPSSSRMSTEGLMKPFINAATDDIEISVENEATTKPMIINVNANNDTYNEGRARAINVHDERPITTTTQTSTIATATAIETGTGMTGVVVPHNSMISVEEGQYIIRSNNNNNNYYNNKNDETKSDHITNATNAAVTTTTEATTTTTTQNSYFGANMNGEGRSSHSDIMAEDDQHNLSHFNYHYNFVTTDRNNHQYHNNNNNNNNNNHNNPQQNDHNYNHEHYRHDHYHHNRNHQHHQLHDNYDKKNALYKELSDVSLDDDDDDNNSDDDTNTFNVNSSHIHIQQQHQQQNSHQHHEHQHEYHNNYNNHNPNQNHNNNDHLMASANLTSDLNNNLTLLTLNTTSTATASEAEAETKAATAIPTTMTTTMATTTTTNASNVSPLATAGPMVKESEPQMKITEITAAGDTIYRECLDAIGKSYKNGEYMERDCDERCTCNRGEWICSPRCSPGTFKRGHMNSIISSTSAEYDHCHEMPIEFDDCCSTMICHNHSHNQQQQQQHHIIQSDTNFPTVASFNVSSLANVSTTTTQKSRIDCHYNGGIYKFRERLEIGCDQICHCDEDGIMNCKARCAPRNHTRLDKCVFVKDPKDVCCQLQLCDVTLDDHEQTPSPPIAQNAIIGDGDNDSNSDDNSGGINDDNRDEIDNHYNGYSEEGRGREATSGVDCEFKGQFYGNGKQFYDGCDQLCLCTKQRVHCAKLQCPSSFGLDVLNPHCLRWEPEPANFQPIAPNCCPDSMRCIDNGTCSYKGHTFDNWSQIPTNLTGCEEHCYCENGKLECRPACPPVLALPPGHLPCPAAHARLLPIPDDKCCKHWSCPKDLNDNDSKVIKGHEEEDTSTSSNEQHVKKKIENEEDLNAVVGKPEDKKLHNTAFYPTLDGKLPTKSIAYDLKPEKMNKKTFQSMKPIQKDVKYDVHEILPDDDLPPGGLSSSGFIPITTNGGQNSPYENVNYNQNLAPHIPNNRLYSLYNHPHSPPSSITSSSSSSPYHPNYHRQDQQQQQQQHQPPKPNDHFQSFETYDINPNGIAQGKPPTPTSQSDLFNLIGANVGHNSVKPINQAHALPTHVHLEHILQHLQQNGGQTAQQNPNVLINLLPNISNNISGPINYQHQHPQHPYPVPGLGQSLPPPYGPIVHSGLPPPPPPHDIAIVDGTPVTYNGYPILPGVGPVATHLSQNSFITSDKAIGIKELSAVTQQRQEQVTSASSKSQKTGFDNSQPDIEIHTLEAIDSHTVRVVFTVPQIYVNLHGRVELRYTNGASNDTTKWEQQIFAPPQDLIATSQMEFDLLSLESNSLYKIKITLLLRDVNAQPSSSIYTVTTPAEKTITPPPPPTDYRPDFQDIFKNIEDPELNVSVTNSTWLQLTWRKISDDQLEYVDGIQLRYKELNDMIYSSTPLIHRSLTSYTIENLQPDTGYEIGIYYIPFPGHGAELRAGHMIKVRTASRTDVYGFEVMVNVTKIKAQSVEVSWNGVPYPEDKYVNIYRAIYQSDSGKEDSSVFKVAKRDSTMGTLIMDLKPGTKYRLWLEMYMTNGKIKKSNVVNFITKPGGPAIPGKTDKLLTAGLEQPMGDYYGPLVIVSVVAALAIMSTLVLLLILTRRRVHQTATITPPRKSDAAYDNPSYKVDIQQETMNL